LAVTVGVKENSSDLRSIYHTSHYCLTGLLLCVRNNSNESGLTIL